MTKNNIKAQIWFSDFVIGIIIFSLVLISYYTYTTNISKQDSSVMDSLVSDSKTISSILLNEGYPSTWTSETVIRMGLTDNNQKIDANLLIESSKIDYNKTKELFGVSNDFFAFFQNKDGKFITFGGDFGIGSTEVNFISNIKIAYYSHQTGDSLMKDFFESIGADIYWQEAELVTLLGLVDDYTLIFMEDCHCDKTAGALLTIEDWVSDGGLAFLSEHHHNKPWPRFVMGVIVDKGDKDGSNGVNATILNLDPLLNLELNKNITFLADVMTLEDDPGNGDAIDYTVLAKWTDPDSSNSIGKGAIARWGFGASDGTVYYFPDYHANFLEGDFTTALEEAIQSRIYQDGFIQINEEYEELIKIERLAIYNSEIVKMVVYVWQ